MGHAYSNLLYHLVFVTKYRSQILTRSMLDLLRPVFREKAEELDSVIYILNGHRDHVHVLISAPPKVSVSQLVKHLKGYSSFVISGLRWQNGYAAFTVDEGSFQRVFEYIRNQERHHGSP